MRLAGGSPQSGGMSGADYLAVFLMGLLGAGHCIGMCGAFSLAASAGAGGPGRILGRQIAYQGGKALSYVFLAVLLTLVGGWLAGAGPLPWLQNAVGALVGGFMIALGLAYALELRLTPGVVRFWESNRVCGAVSAVLQAPTLWRSLLIGWVNGFLPCGLSLAALAFAASFGSVVDAAGGAALFGLATLPGLLAVTLVGRGVFGRGRRWLLRLAGATLVIMGLLTIVRGVPAVHAWFHAHTVLPW